MKKLRKNPTEAEVENFFNEIYRLMENGNYQKALNNLDTIDENHREYPHAMFYKSIIISMMGDDENAEELRKESLIRESEFVFEENDDINENVDDYEYLIGVGLDFQNEGDLDQAIAFFDKATEVNPNQSVSLLGKATCLYQLGEYEETIELLDKAIEIDLDDSLYYSIRGLCLLEVGSLDEALESLNTAIKIDSNNLKAYLVKVKVYIEKQDFENGEKTLNEMPTFEGFEFEYYMSKGSLMMGLENFDDAIEAFGQCIEEASDDEGEAMAWFSKAIAYAIKGDDVEASKCFDEAKELGFDAPSDEELFR